MHLRGFIFKFTRVVIPLGKKCYKKGLVERGLRMLTRVVPSLFCNTVTKGVATTPCRLSVKYRPKMKVSLKKVINIGISPGFWLIREGNDISNIPSKFKTVQSIKFSKWRLLIFSVGNHPLPPTFDGLPYPRGTPDFFFIKMTTKDVL